MSKTISIFFNTDRTYVTLVEKHKDGLELIYLNSTESRIDLENPDSDESVLGAQELEIMLDDLKTSGYSRVTLTMPAESVLVSKIPGGDSMKETDIKKLVNFEIRQNFPQFSFEDFTISVTPFATNNDGKQKMLCVIVPNDVLQVATNLIKTLSHKVDHIEISQLNAHSALLYNYPELIDKNVALVSVQNQFIDISLSKSATPSYYNLASFSSPEQIGEVIENEFQKILSECADTIDAAFFFGNRLNKDIMMSCWETSMMLGIEAKRLNPFRMMRTELESREREYCSRSFQLYPACVGGSLPPYHKRIKLI